MSRTDLLDSPVFPGPQVISRKRSLGYPRKLTSVKATQLFVFPKNPSGVGFSFRCLTARERGSAGVRPEVYHVCSMPCKHRWPGNGRTGGLPAELPARTGPASSAPSFAGFTACRRWSGFKRPEFAAYRASAAGGEMAERAACRLNCRDDLDCR